MSIYFQKLVQVDTPDFCSYKGKKFKKKEKRKSLNVKSVKTEVRRVTILQNPNESYSVDSHPKL